MKIFSSKKGQEQLTEESLRPFIALFIAFTIILIPLLIIINGLDKNTNFERAFLERDIANIIDSLYASPGNIMVDYDKYTAWFSFKFDEDSVNAYEKQDILNLDNIAYYFTPDKTIGYSTMDIKPIFRGDDVTEDNLIKDINLRFAKTDKRLRINKIESLIPNLNELECPEIENAQRFSKSAFKDFDDISEINDLEGRNNAIRNGNDVFVWYYPGSYGDTTTNTIKAFISSDVNLKENRRLACLIINPLLDKLERIADENNLRHITGVSIIPTDSWQMLNQNDYLSVLLEVGNKNIHEEENLWSNEEAKNAILESIDLGVKSYG